MLEEVEASQEGADRCEECQDRDREFESLVDATPWASHGPSTILLRNALKVEMIGAARCDGIFRRDKVEEGRQPAGGGVMTCPGVVLEISIKLRSF